MRLPVYPFKVDEKFLDYEFISSGPKGSIKKIVQFTKIGKDLFNIGFGDLDHTTGEISDTTVTNNNDSKIVLATLAAIIHDFIIQYPMATIYAKGSTNSRTRLYRMGITHQWKEISSMYNVYGLEHGNWQPFIMGKAYAAFLIRKK